ncbi:MAG: cytochrome c peroxidase [Alphaproteobacteria bacterium]
MSCATCHEQKHAFTDTTAHAPGATEEPGRRNIPGLANVVSFNSLTMGAIRASPRWKRKSPCRCFGEHPVEMAMAGKDAELAKTSFR